jgi:putative heme-binding domain-containing protein
MSVNMPNFSPALRGIALFAGFVAALSPSTGGAIAHAAAAGEISLPPGFRSELVYEVPLDSQGSWISLTVDDQGNLIASAEAGGLYRVSPAPIGADAAQTKVEPIGAGAGKAHGLLFHDGQLYVMQNGATGDFGSGLYRLSDTNDDGKFDRTEQLRVFKGQGEHGPHAIALGPDGKSLYFCCGNHTELPLYSRTLVPKLWEEDQLLPRIADPMGHATHIKAPGGWIARTDLDGNQLELFSVGYRNMFDIAFNRDGELFTYDSDMEWDIGTPWYRPTRICHVTSGSDFGWRGGNGVGQAFNPDTLPSAVEAGPGSPTGLTFGAGTKFPEKYQQALFGGDWSYGNIYAFHLSPDGSSYTGEMERFASAMPLGVTDMVVRPQDGALYFAVGGRNSESAIYRIVWTGEGAESEETTEQAAAAPEAIVDPVESRHQRHALEKFHVGIDPQAVDAVWPALGSPDRFLSTAARIALEHQPLTQWSDKALAEPNDDARLNALVAFARLAGTGQQREWAEAIGKFDFAALSPQQRLNVIRAAGLGLMRLEPISSATRQTLLDQFDPQFPTGNTLVDRELASLLVRLKAPNLIDRLLASLEKSATQEEGVGLAVVLSAITDGWTKESRTRFLDWFDQAAGTAGGNSFFGYVVAARDRFIAGISSADRRQLGDRVSKPLVQQQVKIETQTRPFVREWKLDELVDLVENNHQPRDFAAGRKMFSAAGCYNCHRIAGEGSSVGPDLTGLGGRFGVRDLLRSIVEPNHTISDQYQQMVFETGGRIIVGRITNISNDKVMVSTDMLDPKKQEALSRADIDDQHPSDTSVMPAGLLNTLSAEEILDLVAFLRSGGNSRHEMFAAPAEAGGK